ncbi:unnamed protein product [Schistosoma margrebowiei]|uniref:Uncharacterized protein n=1 Tax=Schistosoma margrebowiei TaxID=48269 RepID=A0A183LLE6_9TREM|nr:unnamed protein product [Schistosoma margrebowiei]
MGDQEDLTTVPGISETHRTQAGQRGLDMREMLMYSGHEEENAPQTQAVALILTREAYNVPIGWESHRSIMNEASFKTKKKGVTMNATRLTRKKKQIWRTIKSTKESLTSTCQEVLGRKHHHNECISMKTVDKIQKRKRERKEKKTANNNSRSRTKKVKTQVEYTKSNKQVKKSIRADERKYVEDLATTSEKAARERNMIHLYDTIKKLAGKYSKPVRPVKGTEGKPITEIQEQ